MTATIANDVWLDQVEVQLPNSKKLFRIANWKVPHGAHILVQGPSGSGKTTLLHLIAGLFQPHHGQVHIGGVNLRDLDEGARCDLRRERVGVVFQKLNLLGQLTVQENIKLAVGDRQSFKSPGLGGSPGAPGARHHEGTAADLILASLKRVKIADKIHDRCSHLSLGEQQRVAVARVLAQRPEIILADEPTSSLDRPNALFVIEALKEAAQGKTLIVVSHDERIAKHFDRVLEFSEITR